VSCVVVSVNYRHAPEHRYPTAINDVVDAFTWIVSEEGAGEMGINTARVVIGGLSAGGGLAAILGLKIALARPQQRILLQLLLLPVIDNTATAETSWASNRHAPWLTPSRMMWYRRMYMPNEDDWAKWDASPIHAPSVLLAASPRTWIAAAEQDILCEEAIRYGNKLRENGVDTTVTVYDGSTHSLLMLAGVLQRGKQIVHDAVEAVAQALREADP